MEHETRFTYMGEPLAGKTRDFAVACYDSNTLVEMARPHATIDADDTDCREWGITAVQWSQAIEAALRQRIADATGHEAIQVANRFGVKLCKYADPTEGARNDLSLNEAHEIAQVDPSLIYVGDGGTRRAHGEIHEYE